MPSVNLNPALVTFSGESVSTAVGPAVELSTADVRLTAGRVVVVFPKRLGPRHGFAFARVEALWMALDNLPTKVGHGMMIPHVTIRQGQRVDFLARVVDAEGKYPKVADVEGIDVYLFDESADSDPTEPIYTEELEAEDVWFDDLQTDGYARDVPGGYNLHYALDDETVRLEGSHTYRLELLVVLQDREDAIPIAWRVTCMPMWAVQAS